MTCDQVPTVWRRKREIAGHFGGRGLLDIRDSKYHYNPLVTVETYGSQIINGILRKPI